MTFIAMFNECFIVMLIQCFIYLMSRRQISVPNRQLSCFVFYCVGCFLGGFFLGGGGGVGYFLYILYVHLYNLYFCIALYFAFFLRNPNHTSFFWEWMKAAYSWLSKVSMHDCIPFLQSQLCRDSWPHCPTGRELRYEGWLHSNPDNTQSNINL